MRKSVVVTFVLVLVLGCAKEQPAPQPLATPSEVVAKVYQSFVNQDTAALLKLSCTSRKQRYVEQPERLRAVMEYWRGSNPTVQIISETHDNSIALVTYRLKATGKNPTDTSLSTQLYLEDGAWKFGY